MTLEALYALPSIIGTAPRHAQWSPDGGKLAFAWNEEGRPVRDVWLYSPSDGDLRRLTAHGQGAEMDPAKAGVSELAWLGTGGNDLAYAMDGALYLFSDGRSTRIERQRKGIHSIQVSPGGEFLTYIGSGSRSAHGSPAGESLWIVRIGNEEPGSGTLLVEAPEEGVAVESYEWSKDGDRLAFLVADDRRVSKREIHYYADGGELQVDRVTRAFPGEETTRYRLGVIDAGDHSVRWMPLENDRAPIWSYGLSSDAERLFVNTSDFLVKQHTIYTYDVATGERTLFYRFENPGNVIPGWDAAWAPHDEGLIILSSRDGFYHLYHQREALGSLRALTSGNWSIASFEVDSRNRLVYFVANKSHPSERQVYRVPLDGGTVEAVTAKPGTWRPVFSPDFSRVALNFSSDYSPPDLYTHDLSSGGATNRVTRSPLPAFENHAWADVRYLRFRSHVDGTWLHARLSVPPDFDPSRQYPLIVGSVYANTLRNQWGGRTAHPTWGLDQYLVAQGYLILNVNVRGSWGQGTRFSEGLFHDYGGIDIDDIESGVRYVIEQGFVDPDRVGIWGSSYGGLMTLMSLFEKPDVYAVGIAGAPATNVAHAFPSQMWVMGEPRGRDYPERYRRQSPLYHHEGLRDPVMIIHGTRDAVVLYSDTVALVERMIESGKQFELVTLTGARHGWDTEGTAQTLFAYKKMVDFFDRYLRPCGGRRHVRCGE